MSRDCISPETINLDVLRSLPTYELAPSYHLQREAGNGCSGDAPGYPTYYTRSIYTRHGNSPAWKVGRPTQVICFEGKNYVTGFHGQTDVQRESLMKRLYKPLPEAHERVQQWERQRYSHHHHCYYHPTEKEYGTRRATVIFPVPAYKLQKFVDDPRFSEDWRVRAKALVAATNQEEIMQAEAVCTPDNHSAVVLIREVYPDHVPVSAWIETSPDNTGDWWETMDVRPTPETCPGRYPNSWPSMGHNTTGRCQMCGHTPTLITVK